MKISNIIRSLAVAALFGGAAVANAQFPALLHSHNDYVRTMPFYEAYSQHIYSIECDMFFKDGKLLIGHDLEDLRPDFTFERFYLNPIVELYKMNGGKPYADSDAG
ncbi:MAG: alkaline phosphatase, partial [Muribaculaceae bacterium]